MDQAFRDAISTGYGFGEPTLIIGSAMHEGELFNDVRVLCAAHLSIEGDQRGRVQLAQQPLHDCLPIHVVPLG